MVSWVKRLKQDIYIGRTAIHTSGMATIKTSILIEETLFRRAKELAEELQVSWSRLVSLALKAYIEHYEAQKITDKLNEVYADGLTQEDEEILEAGRRMFLEILEDDQW